MYKVIELEVNPEISGDTGVFEVAWVEYPAIEQELMYFGQQRFYKAPENVSAKACRAIKENEERGNPAATQTGKIRAQQLCNRDEISLETVKRMKSYLERAATYYTGNYDDNGTISYDLWGGKPALEWVDSILKDMDMGVQDFVKPGPTESKDEFIGRCIAYVKNEGKTDDQAAGQCYGMWDNREFAATRVSFDWDETLSTEDGKKLLENELSRGSIIYIISARNSTTQSMYDVANKYGFPASHIYTTGSNKAKVEKIKELGIKRHYDNNTDVVNDLGGVGIQFDYDVASLPDYANYPSSGDTDAMLVEPQLPPVLFEECGCGGGMFEGLEDACWEGYIAIGTKIVNGREVPNCVPKDSAEGMSVDQEFALDEYTKEELEAYEILMEFKKTDEQKFAEFVTKIDGRTEAEVRQLNVKSATPFFRYDRKVTMKKGPDRVECMRIEGKYFRRMEIDLMRNLALKYGHNGQPYSKWLWKFGPNCVHAWRKFLVQGNNFADQGWAEGQAGNAMLKETPNNGYYSSKQSMSSVSYMKDISCAFGDVCTPKLDTTEQVFAAKTEERMIYTPLMIPDILIPRIDEVTNEKYYVKFKPNTIQIIRDKFMAELRNRKTNLEHTDKKFEDIVMVETWIVKGEKDKAYEMGFTQEQVPFGTWMAAYKVLETPEGNLVWNKYIKPGVVRGASVEGNFLLNFSQQKGDEYLLEQVINIINQITD